MLGHHCCHEKCYLDHSTKNISLGQEAYMLGVQARLKMLCSGHSHVGTRVAASLETLQKCPKYFCIHACQEVTTFCILAAADPVHLPHLIGPMKHYLWILKTTHGGADMDTCVEMAKGSLDGELPLALCSSWQPFCLMLILRHHLW